VVTSNCGSAKGKDQGKVPTGRAGRQIFWGPRFGGPWKERVEHRELGKLYGKKKNNLSGVILPNRSRGRRANAGNPTAIRAAPRTMEGQKKWGAPIIINE